MTEVVVDNGKAFVSEESATIATEAAAQAKQWAEESESQANIATRASDDAAQAKDDAVAAKEYAEAAVTDVNLITVATDLRTNPSNIKTVANNISNISAVAANNTNITAVANNATNINAVNANKTNIDKVAGDINRVNLVADDIASVHTVAVDISTVIDVANNKTNIDTTAANISSINTNAANITAIQNASANAQLARDWAVKMNGLVASEDYSAKYYADQARQAAAGAVVDGVTINRNTNDELQTIGVIDDNNGNALKIWTGTKAEYETLLPTIDNNTLYNVTDTEEIYKGLTLIADKTKASSIISALGYTPADDTGVVHKAGDETITGQKTFTPSTHQTLFTDSELSVQANANKPSQFRAIDAYNKYGFLIRNDGAATYFLPTNINDPYGIYNVNAIGMIIDNATGVVQIRGEGGLGYPITNNGTSVTGQYGYMKLSNDITIQWGVIPGSGTYSFHKPFTSGCIVVLTGTDGSGVNNNNAVTNVTTTNFNTSVFGAGGAYWIAIGK